ncbi:MAG: SIS domain-containing protein [Chloroflexi bacterium]|nr:SIS domain-containing protein [Chloroflexota bacterium]
MIDRLRWILPDWLRTDLDELHSTLRTVSSTNDSHLGEIILRADRIFVTGQGRTGLVMRMFAMRLMQLVKTAFVLGDVTTPAVGPGDLLIAGSGSGETDGVVSVARRAREMGVRVAAITSKPDSSLAKLADHTTVISGATSQLPMVSVVEQALLIFTDCIAAWLASQSGQTNETMRARHANLE